jgi:hypothetical protein
MLALACDPATTASGVFALWSLEDAEALDREVQDLRVVGLRRL